MISLPWSLHLKKVNYYLALKQIKSWRWAEVTVGLIMVSYVIWFSFLSIRQHEALMTGGLDLGNMSQTVWNTSRGQFMRMTTMEGLSSRLGGHVDPILVLLVPLYWIAPDPRTLLIVQTVVLASGAWAAYQLACWKLERVAAGVIMAAVYLLAPLIQGANLFEFHPVTLAAALLLFAIYHMLRGEFGRFAFFAGLTSLCKEDMPAIVALMGLYVWLIKRDRRGAWLALAATGWFLLANLWIVPTFSDIGTNIHYVRYQALGKDLAEIGWTVLADPVRVWRVVAEPTKLFYLFSLLFPVGFLSLLSPVILLLAVPSLAVNMLSQHAPMYIVDLQHYSAPIWPFVLASAIVGIGSASRFLQRCTGWSRGFWLVLLVGYVTCFSLANQGLRGRTPLSSTFVMPEITAHDRLAAHFLEQIPPGAIVSAQNQFVSHLSERPTVYIFPKLGEDTQWVLLDVSVSDLNDIYPLASWPAYYAAVDRVLAGGEFVRIDAADGYLLLQRQAPAHSLPDGSSP